MISAEDLPALAIVALCLRELRGVRLGLELALAQLRGDLRAVLALLTGRPLPAQHGGGLGQTIAGGDPPVIGVGAGGGGGELGELPDSLEGVGQGEEERRGLEDATGAGGVSDERGHATAYRPRRRAVAH